MKRRTYQKSPGTVLIAGKEERISIPNLTEQIPSIVWSPSLLGAFEKAHLALGRLNGLAAALSNSASMRNMFYTMEAVSSSRVDGMNASLSDVLLFELGWGSNVAAGAVLQAWKTAQALRECMHLLDNKLPLSLRLIEKLHFALSDAGHEDAAPSVAGWIVDCLGDGVLPQSQRQNVRGYMAKLERFLQDYDSPTPALLKAALAYARFQSIHPSLGRLGRILIAAILHAHGAVSGPAICVSGYIVAHRNRYESTLDAAMDSDKWTGWLEFFAEAVAWAAEQSAAAISRIQVLATSDQERIETLGRAADSAGKVYLAFFERPITTSSRLVKATGLTPMTVNKSLTHLERLGIVRELSDRPRNRLYQYDQYLRSMSKA